MDETSTQKFSKQTQGLNDNCRPNGPNTDIYETLH